MPNDTSEKRRGTSKKDLTKFWKSFVIAALAFLVVYFALSPKADFNPGWIEPTRLKSENNLLKVDLDAKKSLVKIGEKQVESPIYNNVYPGMTWEVKQGDQIKVHLQNDLKEPTNLHFHGSHVSPKGNSDNVLLTISPGTNFDYDYDLIKNPPGLYWYHPHMHPLAEDQVMGGMAGAIIVRGDVDQLPGIKGLPERLLVLTTQDGNDPNTPQRLVNGMQNPTMYLRPGQTIRMEVVNASADDHFNFAIPGYKLHIFSRDGNTMDQIQDVDNEIMSPGQRIQFIFTPRWYGEIPVKSLYQDQGFAKYVETTFMNIKVAGLPMIAKSLPSQLLPYEDLRNAKIDKVRTLTFSEGGTKDAPTFLLDGKMVNMDRVDQVITLGTTEEWHLVNQSFEGHPFHIHINPFQVISVNGKPVDSHGLRDTVGIPPYGEVVIRTRYKDFDGKFVLHCHILFHEDHGMMQVVEIVPAGESVKPDNGLPSREMKGMTH